MDFPGGSVVKNPPANAGDTGDRGSVPGSGRSSGEGNDNPSEIFMLLNCGVGLLRVPWTARRSN